MNIRIENRNITFFNDFNFTLRYNSVASSFDFRANFDPNNSAHRLVFKPLSYGNVILEHNGELLLTGRIVNHSFSIKNTKDLSSFSGYSLPGVLEDSPIGLDQYPLEFNNLTLKEIASKLLIPHNLSLIVNEDAAVEADIPYDEVTAEDSESIKSFLAELAFQRGLIISHNEDGSLVITKTNVNRDPVETYTESHGVTEISLNTNGQSMHSTIHAQSEADIDEGSNAAESSIVNPLIPIYRPTVKMQTSGDDNDTGKFARSALGAELRNIKVNVKVYQWEWIKNGKRELIRPNNVILVQSPQNHIFQKRKFFIEAVNYIGNQKQQIAEMQCVPVEAYSDSDDLSSLNGFFDA